MRDFPDGPMVVKTSCFQCRGESSIPGRGTKTYVPWGVAKKKKKICDERPNSFVVFQNCFRYSVLFAFRIICYFLPKKKKRKKERKKTCWDFDIDCIDFVDQFDESVLIQTQIFITFFPFIYIFQFFQAVFCSF